MPLPGDDTLPETEIPLLGSGFSFLKAPSAVNKDDKVQMDQLRYDYQMIFISVLDSNYSCCVYWLKGVITIEKSFVVRSTKNPQPSSFVIMNVNMHIIHLNYSILMMIKLLIRNKKVLDVAIVIHSFTHV